MEINGEDMQLGENEKGTLRGYRAKLCYNNDDGISLLMLKISTYTLLSNICDAYCTNIIWLCK